MGIRNLRAICPNCGGKIHTQPKGLGHITWANNWLLVQTGKECQHCGVALTGKVKMDNHAELAGAEKSSSDVVPPQGEMVGLTLLEVGPRQIQVIKVLTETMGFKFMEAKQLTDEAPSTIARAIVADGAKGVKERLERVGASVEVTKPASSGSPRKAGGDEILSQIEKMGELRDAGILTAGEFETKKAELLARL